MEGQKRRLRPSSRPSDGRIVPPTWGRSYGSVWRSLALPWSGEPLLLGPSVRPLTSERDPGRRKSFLHWECLNPNFVCRDHKCYFKTPGSALLFTHRPHRSVDVWVSLAPPQAPCKSAHSKSRQADAAFVRKSSGSLKRRKVPRLLAALCFWHHKLFPEAHSGPPGASVRQRQHSNGFTEAPFSQTCGFVI